MTPYVDSLDFAHSAAKATRRQSLRDYAPALEEFAFCRDFIVTAVLRVVKHQT
jgi:hypothetical protein